ncbi:type I-E CRISPR-associated endoribonuclease Cas2e [Brachybacterium hainanense]|uniref:Type I-E CRISPR-associated endoribonuclease Cas2e n=1 Tax=Brachybacterium hainanense TaxID=1541174 RepID=A0ABV6R882_9MICO
MITLVLTACPPGLRGDLTKWLMEVSPGVFVGRPSARIRDELWLRVLEQCRDGKALLVYSMNNEQGLEYRVHNHDWHPVDVDGVTLMLRPAAQTEPTRSTGWSNARAMRRARRPR